MGSLFPKSFLAAVLIAMASTSATGSGILTQAQTSRGHVPRGDEPIIVVGGGLAGLSSALEVLERSEDARVILFDKESNLGGNSAKASSGINGCGTEAQKRLGIKDSTQLFYSDTLAAGDRENDPQMVQTMVEESPHAISFLMERGVNLSDVNLGGGHSVPRTHWIPSPLEGKPFPVGIGIINAVRGRLYAIKEKQPERVDVRLNSPVVGLVTWNDYITGVRYRNSEGKVEELNGKAVILATGGFSADRDNETSLLAEYASGLLPLPTTNGKWATGDGVKMARAMGAAVIGMNRVQVHPTAFIDPANPRDQTKFLAAEALRGKGAILLNKKGRRFGNELGRRDYLTQQIQKHCALNPAASNLPSAFLLMNRASAQGFGMPAFNFYHKIKGFFKELNGVGELAESIGCDVAELRKTLEDYNSFARRYLLGEQGVKDEFGKTVFPVEFNLEEIFYVAQLTPAIHYTCGGLKVSVDSTVYSDFLQRPFKGLLAAGEVTGGVHGSNRLAGNSLLECAVYGRIAGRTALAIDYSSEAGQPLPSPTQVKLSGEREEL